MAKSCVTCEHVHAWPQSLFLSGSEDVHLCKRPRKQKFDPVQGFVSPPWKPCAVERKSKAGCGPSGRYWAEAQKREPVRIEIKVPEHYPLRPTPWYIRGSEYDRRRNGR